MTRTSSRLQGTWDRPPLLCCAINEGELDDDDVVVVVITPNLVTVDSTEEPKDDDEHRDANNDLVSICVKRCEGLKLPG